MVTVSFPVTGARRSPVRSDDGEQPNTSPAHNAMQNDAFLVTAANCDNVLISYLVRCYRLETCR